MPQLATLEHLGNHSGSAGVLHTRPHSGPSTRGWRRAVGVRRAAKGVGDFLVETVGEAVAEVILSLLACALLGCLALIAYLSWSFSPCFTIAGSGLLSLFLAHGAWQTLRAPAKGRRRGLAALTAVGFTVTAPSLLFYAAGCDCL
ncbi:lysine transporter LysE [Streptomyces sp. NPDC059499]|uniref:lysine transporter LysE n=1 Tax=Streptomyces sp. NPDC059499 TaxID=3346852 RepID=UPI0036CCD537